MGRNRRIEKTECLDGGRSQWAQPGLDRWRIILERKFIRTDNGKWTKKTENIKEMTGFLSCYSLKSFVHIVKGASVLIKLLTAKF
jgi:hypothetical protein